MNIKNLRKDYHLLSMRERFALHQAAVLRDDDAEMNAVRAASPTIKMNVSDFYYYAVGVVALQQSVLLERLGHAQKVETCLQILERAEVIHNVAHLLQPKYKPMTKNFGFEQQLEITAATFGYLYVVTTDAWTEAGTRFGLNVELWREKQAKFYPIFDWLEKSDELIRVVAYSEAEVREQIKDKDSEICTLENLTALYAAELHQHEAECLKFS